MRRATDRQNTQLQITRRSLGLTQAQVAQQARIVRAHYGHIETGARIPTLPVARRVSRVLGLSVDAFCDLLDIEQYQEAPHA